MISLDILLNGKSETVPEGSTLSDLLTSVGIDTLSTKGIAVAVNQDVVRRTEWVQTNLSAGDEIEIVTALQGG